MASPDGQSTSEATFSIRPKPAVDLRFLQERSGFHPLTTEDVDELFLNSPNQPPRETSLPDLLQNGHFRRAADTSLNELLRCSPTGDDADRIFQLLYTRLACLTLINRPDLAAHEAAALTDYLARSPPGAASVVPLIPWELRLLLVRLQSANAEDGGRRAIMSLYALTAEVRSHIRDARRSGNQQDVQTWSQRLRDLGLGVADTLVEMGELETASRHLDTLVDAGADDLAYRRALLRLRVGDISGAKRNIDAIQHSPSQRAALNALFEFTNGKASEAIASCQSHAGESTTDSLFASNMAVGLLYTGHITLARDIFEAVSQKQPAFPGLLFNLGTVYELCSDRAMARKADLMRTMAAKQPTPDSGGWERASFEFKM